MPGISRELAEHALQVDPNARPIKQSLRRFSEPNRKAIGEEINMLLEAKFIREIKQATLGCQPSPRPEKEHGSTSDVCGLHLAEQALPEGSLSSTSN